MARLNSILALSLLLPLSSVAQVISSGPIMRTIAAAGGASTLNTDLISYWKLDEASGSRADSEPTGTAQNLTDNNTVTSATGKINDAAHFVVANSEYLNRVDSADLSTGQIDFTVAAWVKLNTKGANRTIVSKYNPGGNGEFILRYNNTADRWSVQIFDNSSLIQTLNATTAGSPSTGTWYLIIFRHDSTGASAGTIYLSVNGGTEDSAGSTGWTVRDTTAEFIIGAYYISNQPWDGDIDEVGFWKKLLSSDERAELYNSSNGKTCCPF
jgi:hypothetical protein